MRSIPSQLNFLLLLFFFVLKWFSTKKFQTMTKCTLHLFPMVKIRKITKNIFSPKGKKWSNIKIQIHFQRRIAKMKLWVAERSVSFVLENIWKGNNFINILWLRFLKYWKGHNETYSTEKYPAFENVNSHALFY